MHLLWLFYVASMTISFINSQIPVPLKGTDKPTLKLETMPPLHINNTHSGAPMVLTTQSRKTSEMSPLIIRTQIGTLPTLVKNFTEELIVVTAVETLPLPTPVTAVSNSFCTLFGKNYTDGTLFYPGLGIRPNCIGCFCLHGVVHCDGSYVKGTAFYERQCNGDCETFVKEYSEKDCADPTTVNCHNAGNITWFQNGCQYTCNKGFLKTKFIETPWCQRLTNQNTFCATSCPDKERSLKLYKDVFTLCKRKEAIVYNSELCDGRYDCDDKSDEEDCPAINCNINQTRLLGKDIQWERTEIGKFAEVDCSVFNSHYTSFVKRKCLSSNASSDIKSVWDVVNHCECMPKNPSEFKINESVSTLDEVKKEMEKLDSISLKSMYSHGYLRQALALLTIMYRQLTNTTDISEIFPIINPPENMIVLKKLCQTEADQEIKHRINMTLESIAKKYGFGRLTILPERKDENNVIIGLSSFTIDLQWSLDKLASRIKKETGLSNTTVQSVQENPKYNDLIKTIVKDYETRKDLLLVEVVTSAISLVAVCFTLIVFAVLRMANSTRLLLHKNLLAAYGLFCVMLIAGVASTDEMRKVQGACVVFLCLFHYFLLAVFTWMLLEGIHLMVILIFVFEMRKKRHGIFLLCGWGLPLLILGVMWAIDWQAFVNSKTCLNLGEKVWLIRAPILTIIIINFGIGTVVLASIIRQQMRKSKEKIELSRSVAKAFLVLSPLLGFFWIFSIFVDSHIVFAYISSSLNTLTGLAFFIFHCLLDKQVQAKMKYSNVRILKFLSIETSSTARSQSNGIHMQRTPETPRRLEKPSSRKNSKLHQSTL